MRRAAMVSLHAAPAKLVSIHQALASQYAASVALACLATRPARLLASPARLACSNHQLASLLVNHALQAFTTMHQAVRYALLVVLGLSLHRAAAPAAVLAQLAITRISRASLSVRHVLLARLMQCRAKQLVWIVRLATSAMPLVY